MAVSWFWPPSGLSARGVACVPFGTRLAVPDWTQPRYFPFTPGIGFGPPVNLMAVPSGGVGYTLGISAAAADGARGMYLTSYAGAPGIDTFAWHVTSGGVATTYTVPSGKCCIGAAYISPSGYILASDGTVLREAAGNTFASLGTWPSGATSFASSGSTLLSVMPSGAALLTMTTGGVSGLIALPSGTSVGVPSCVAASSGGFVAVAGYRPRINAAQSIAAGALDPQNPAVMLTAGSGIVLEWTAPSALSENWGSVGAISGLANLTAIAWRPDGTQALTTSPASGVVQVIGYAAGVISLLQTLAVSGACAVVVAGGSTNALVAQSGQSRAMPLTFGAGVWSTGTPVTGMPGITQMASLGPSAAVAAVSGGVAYLGLIAGTWTLLNTVPLGFTPNTIATDPFAMVYAAGSGALMVLSGSTLLGSGTWAGAAPTAIAVHEGRVVMAIPSDGLLRVYGESSPGAWTQQNAVTLSLGAQVGLALTDTVLFTLGSSGSSAYNTFSGTPYELTTVFRGVSWIWNGSTWTTTQLNLENTPSAMSFDPSGNIRIVTAQDTIWSLTTGGVVLSSGAVPTFSGQPQTVPLGASAVIVASGHTCVATSMAGVLVDLS